MARIKKSKIRTQNIKKLDDGNALPIKDVATIEKIKQAYIEEGEYRGLLAFLLAINTGLKIKDILELKVGDIRNKDIMAIVEPVSKEIVSFVLTNEIKKIAQIVVGDRKKDDNLFNSSQGHRLHRTSIYLQFNKISKKMGTENKYSLASWRKTFAYHYYKVTQNIGQIMYMFHQSSVVQAFEFIDEEQNLSLNLDRRFAL